MSHKIAKLLWVMLCIQLSITGCSRTALSTSNKSADEFLGKITPPTAALDIGLNLDLHSILQTSAAEQQQVIADLKELGINSVRIEYNAFNYDGTFTSQGESQKRNAYVSFISRLWQQGIRTNLLLDYMSYNSHGTPQKDKTLLYDATQMTQFVKVAVGSGNNLMSQFYNDAHVRTFEIWNEPNFTWRVTPAALAQSLRFIYNYKKNDLPEARIIAAGIESGKGNNSNFDNPIARSYVTELYSKIYDRQNPQLVDNHPPFDALAAHPYGWFGSELTAHLKKVYIDTLAHFGDSRTRLWITEVGSAERNDQIHWQQINQILGLSPSASSLRLEAITFFTYRFYNESVPNYYYSFVGAKNTKRWAFQRLKQHLAGIGG